MANEIRDAFNIVYADGPSTNPSQPNKSAVRPLGSLIDAQLAGISGRVDTDLAAANARIDSINASVTAGYKFYSTKAALTADTGQADETRATVDQDPVASNNGTYSSAAGAWTKIADYVPAEVVAARGGEASLDARFDKFVTFGGTVNLFDGAAITSGYEVYVDGTLKVQADSVISDLMYVRGLKQITISGLQPNTTTQRYGRFLAADKTTIVAFGPILAINASQISATFAVPETAYYLQFSPRQRNPVANDFSTAQVEAGGIATPYQPYVKAAAVANSGVIPRTRLEFSGDRNLFDGVVLFGYEINSTGAMAAQATSATTKPIRILGASFVTVSGLPANPDFPNRYYRFLASDKTTVVGHGVLNLANTGTFAVPLGAVYFQMSLRQRQTGTISFITVQIEAGASATTYQTFTPRILTIDDYPIKLIDDGGAAAAWWRGRDFLLCGDSITETGNVDAGDYSITSGRRRNWPNDAFPLLSPNSVFNYAKSGAHFASVVGLTTFQKLENQISQAITDGRTPNVIIVSIGTNDLGGTIGDYATAMGKSIGSLDLTVSIEAARSAFYRLQQQWPGAVKFYCTPIQRAVTYTPEAMQPTVDLFAKMAGRYGFEVIDQFRESGIVADFEVNGGSGVYLSDGLHPNPAGQALQGKLIASGVRARLVG